MKFKKFQDLSRSQQNRRLKNFLNLNKDYRNPKILAPLKNNVNLSMPINNHKENQVVNINEDYVKISCNDKESTTKSELLRNNLEQYNYNNNYRQFIDSIITMIVQNVTKCRMQ